MINKSVPFYSEGGLQRLLLTATDGARAEIYAHGAHLTSWIPAAGGERLYLSRRARFEPGVAIRGGVPVIFPQFAGEGPLAKHGFARALPWELMSVSQPAHGPACAVFRLVDTAETWRTWAQAFTAELRVSVGGDALEMTLQIQNTGGTAFSFTAALHTYLRVAAIEEVRLRGLQGLRYRDTARGATEAVETQAELRIEGEVDRIYFDAPARLELTEPSGGLRIQSSGFRDTVVWNPGAARAAALHDLDADGWRHFLCVEAAAIGVPPQLQPGQCWSGTQKLLRL